MHVVFNNVCIVLASFIIRRRILIQNKVTYAQVTVAAVIAYIPALITLLLQYGIPRTTSYISGADSFISEFQLPFEEEYAVLILHLGSWEVRLIRTLTWLDPVTIGEKRAVKTHITEISGAHSKVWTPGSWEYSGYC